MQEEFVYKNLKVGFVSKNEVVVKLFIPVEECAYILIDNNTRNLMLKSVVKQQYYSVSCLLILQMMTNAIKEWICSEALTINSHFSI